MSPQTENINKLSHPVTEAIHQGKKIEAIKLLREEKNIGLKEAKEIVDLYIKQNNIQAPPSETGSFVSFMVFLVTAAACYFLYNYFA